MKKNSQLLLMKVIPDFKSGPKYGYEQPRLMRTSYETIPPLQLETSGGVLSTVTWWCNDATALAGYATMMTILMDRHRSIYSASTVARSETSFQGFPHSGSWKFAK